MMPLICMMQVPPAAMRYADVGDWHYSHKGREIRVPRGLSDEETLLLMVHELVESFMVSRDGVHEAAVNAFDQAHADADEAGALSAAPYHDHAAATKVEKKLAAVLGVRWATYDRDTDRLYETVKAALHAPD
jgi:hypothetical protein